MEEDEREMTREEKRALKRQRRKEAKSAVARQGKLKKYIFLFIGGVFVVGAFYGGILLVNKPAEARPGEEFPIEGRAHVADGTQVDYQTNPPTSGDHYAVPADWGVYQEELPDGNVVHALEHGGIWISYKGIDDETKGRLEEIAGKNRFSVIVSPREANDSPIAVASWGRLLKMETLDEKAIEDFIRINKNNSPERLAR